MASTYLSRTLGTPTNAYKGTLSWWQKGMNPGSTQYILACESGQERLLWYGTSGQFQGGLRGSSGSPNIDFTLSGTPRFRDTFAWYHCVLAWDSTQGTASDRIKYYVNGVQYTVSGSGTSGVNDIPQNHVMPMNKSGLPFRIGSQISGGSYFEGVMSHIHFCDGTQYQASDFGETDSTTGEWKIKTSPSVTYGNNGFWWLKDTNAATDSSPNSNTPTISGTLTKTEDCPSNVFATLNPLLQKNDITLSNGNNSCSWGSATTRNVMLSNLGMSSGKYYCEVKVSASSLSPANGNLGIINGSDNSNMGKYLNQDNSVYQGAGYQMWDGSKNINQTGSSYGATLAVGDILGMAIDMDNKALYFHKNGTYQDSGDPTSGSSKTGAVDFSSLTDNGFWFILIGDGSSSGTLTLQTNFGNGYFGTTAVSSAGTNASGNGIFEYDVPTGYTALSTKGLNE